MPFRSATARRRAACLTIACLVGAAACRDLGFEPQDPATVAYASSLGINLSQFTRLLNGVYVRDVAVGSGTQAESTSTVGINYRGYLASGQAFDTTYATATYTQPLAGFVPGFRTGLLGVRQGSRRQLIVPPGLAYGNRTYNAIPAGSVLFFDVNLVNVTTPAPTTASSRAPR